MAMTYPHRGELSSVPHALWVSLRESSGTVLIISVAVVEVLRQQKIDKSGIVNAEAPPRDKGGILSGYCSQTC
jgi:hypothetical protein